MKRLLCRLTMLMVAATCAALVLASAGGAGHDTTNTFHLGSDNSHNSATHLDCSDSVPDIYFAGCLEIQTFASEPAIYGFGPAQGVVGVGATGVQGLSAIGDGVEGRTTSGATGAVGVRGRLAAANPGVGSAAVKGETASTAPNAVGPGVWGVHEESTGTSPGVLGTTVSTSAGAFAMRGVLQSANPGSSAAAVRGENQGTNGVGIGVWGSHASGGWGVLGESASDIGVYGRTGSTTHLGAGVFGEHTSANGASPGVYGRTVATAPQAAGVIGEVAQSSPGNFASGVRARNLGTTGEGTGLWASHEGAGFGVYSTSVGGTGVNGIHTSSSGTQAGVSGTSFSNAQLAAGVHGNATGNSALVAGVYGTAANGIGLLGVGGNIGLLAAHPAGGVAGLFLGDVHVQGTLSKSAGSFRIDHPLDPEHKYLQHSFVESPDMKNVYDGVILTDHRGFATVRLPRYFQSLNRDFRYQLTIVGDRGWRARVVREIAANRFTIQSDEPRVKVSWQVTGIRKDAYANAHRIQPEIRKPAIDESALLRRVLKRS
jgi:hypothetical protein